MPGKICRAACKGCRVRRPMRLRKALSRKRLPQVWRWPAGCRSAEARSYSAEALLCRVSPQISLPFSLRSIPSGRKRPQLEPKPTPGSSRPCSMLPPPRRRHPQHRLRHPRRRHRRRCQPDAASAHGWRGEGTDQSNPIDQPLNIPVPFPAANRFARPQCPPNPPFSLGKF